MEQTKKTLTELQSVVERLEEANDYLVIKLQNERKKSLQSMQYYDQMRCALEGIIEENKILEAKVIKLTRVCKKLRSENHSLKRHCEAKDANNDVVTQQVKQMRSELHTQQEYFLEEIRQMQECTDQWQRDRENMLSKILYYQEELQKRQVLDTVKEVLNEPNPQTTATNFVEQPSQSSSQINGSTTERNKLENMLQLLDEPKNKINVNTTNSKGDAFFQKNDSTHSISTQITQSIVSDSSSSEKSLSRSSSEQSNTSPISDNSLERATVSDLLVSSARQTKMIERRRSSEVMKNRIDLCAPLVETPSQLASEKQLEVYGVRPNIKKFYTKSTIQRSRLDEGGPPKKLTKQKSLNSAKLLVMIKSKASKSAASTSTLLSRRSSIASVQSNTSHLSSSVFSASNDQIYIKPSMGCEGSDALEKTLFGKFPGHDRAERNRLMTLLDLEEEEEEEEDFTDEPGIPYRAPSTECRRPLRRPDKHGVSNETEHLGQINKDLTRRRSSSVPTSLGKESATKTGRQTYNNIFASHVPKHLHLEHRSLGLNRIAHLAKLG